MGLKPFPLVVVSVGLLASCQEAGVPFDKEGGQCSRMTGDGALYGSTYERARDEGNAVVSQGFSSFGDENGASGKGVFVADCKTNQFTLVYLAGENGNYPDFETVDVFIERIRQSGEILDLTKLEQATASSGFRTWGIRENARDESHLRCACDLASRGLLGSN
jgi:hypothetical protein